MALGTPTDGGAAYSALNGTSVSPAYPASIASGDCLVLIVGQKPNPANSGTVTTPSGWTLRDSLTGAGGYGATLGADTGNTNLFFYTKNTVSGTETGNLAVTVGTNNICWALIVRIPSGAGEFSYGTADGSRTTAPTSGTGFTTLLTNGATAPNLKSGDMAIWAMCVPTDVISSGQPPWSNPTISSTGTTFGTPVELEEPLSGTGTDIGGYVAYAAATAGSSTAAPTVGATATGIVTNIRGPIVLIRVRELPSINAEPRSFSYTGAAATTTATRAVTASAGSFTYTGADATLTKTSAPKEINAEPGSFSYTGAAADLDAARKLSLDAGSFTYTGADATLTATRSLTLAAGSFTYTGAAADLDASRNLSLDAGAFSYSGAAATLTPARQASLDAGSFTYTGAAADLDATRKLSLDAGSFTYTGADATLTYVIVRTLSAEPAAFTYTGAAATLQYDALKQINAEPAAFTYTGVAATLNATRQLVAGPAAFAQSPYVDPGYVDPGYVGNAGAALTVTRSLTLAAGSFAYTGSNATLAYSRRITISALAGAFTYTGAAATLGYSRRFSALAGAFTYTGAPATFQKYFQYPPEADVLAGVVYGPNGIYTGTYTPPAGKQVLYIFDD